MSLNDLGEMRGEAAFEEHLGEGRVRISLGHPAYCWNPAWHPGHEFHYERLGGTRGSYYCDGDGDTARAVAQAYVDSQVAAARADERAKVLAVIEQEAELRQDGAMGGPVWTVTLSEVRAAFAAEADHG